MLSAPVKGIISQPITKGSGSFTRYYKLANFDHRVQMKSMEDSKCYPSREYPQYTNVKECILCETADINIRNEQMILSILSADDFEKYKGNGGNSKLTPSNPLQVIRMDPKDNEKGVMMLIRVIPTDSKDIIPNDILLETTKCVSDTEKRAVAWQFPKNTEYKIKYPSVKLQLIAATFNDATGLVNRDRKYEIKGHIFVKQQRKNQKTPKAAPVSSTSTTLVI